MEQEGGWDAEGPTGIIDWDQLRWLLHMCRTGEGLADEPPRLPETVRPPAEEMRHSIVSTLPDLVLDD